MEQLLQNASTLLGVLLGGLIGLLSPAIANRYERKKRKISIKSDLIHHLSLFYGLIKDHTHSTNWIKTLQLDFQRQNEMMKASLQVGGNSLGMKEGVFMHLTNLDKERTDRILKDIYRMEEKGNITYHKMIEIEAKMFSLISDISTYYDRKSFIIISKIIKGLLKNHNDYDFLWLFNYDSLTIADVDRLYVDLPKKLKKRSYDLDAMLDSYIEEINLNL